MTLAWQELKQKISSALHAFVDRALESSSLALYDQSLRDMEDYIAYVEEAAVGMKAAAEGNRRRLGQHQIEAEALQTRLDQLLAENQTEQAQRVQQALEVKQQQIADTQAQIERQETQHEALVHNWQTLKGRLRVLQGERGSVEALVALSRAQRTIGSIEVTLGGLAGLGHDSELGIMAGHILQRLDEAEARLALVDVDAEVARAVAAIEEAQVDTQIDERRRRLGLAPEQSPPPQPAQVAETPQPEAPEAAPPAPEETGEPPSAPEA